MDQLLSFGFATIACTAVVAAAIVVSLLIVLRGTTPEQRPAIIQALVPLFRKPPREKRSP